MDKGIFIQFCYIVPSVSSRRNRNVALSSTRVAREDDIIISLDFHSVLVDHSTL